MEDATIRLLLVEHMFTPIPPCKHFGCLQMSCPQKYHKVYCVGDTGGCLGFSEGKHLTLRAERGGDRYMLRDIYSTHSYPSLNPYTKS